MTFLNAMGAKFTLVLPSRAEHSGKIGEVNWKVLVVWRDHEQICDREGKGLFLISLRSLSHPTGTSNAK